MSRMLSLRPYASWMTTTPGNGPVPSSRARKPRKDCVVSPGNVTFCSTIGILAYLQDICGSGSDIYSPQNLCFAYSLRATTLIVIFSNLMLYLMNARLKLCLQVVDY